MIINLESGDLRREMPLLHDALFQNVRMHLFRADHKPDASKVWRVPESVDHVEHGRHRIDHPSSASITVKERSTRHCGVGPALEMESDRAAEPIRTGPTARRLPKHIVTHLSLVRPHLMQQIQIRLREFRGEDVHVDEGASLEEQGQEGGVDEAEAGEERGALGESLRWVKPCPLDDVVDELCWELYAGWGVRLNFLLWALHSLVLSELFEGVGVTYRERFLGYFCHRE